MNAGDGLPRIDGVENEAGIEDVRDVLDKLGVKYEHVRSEPEDSSYPRTVYFNVSFTSGEEVERLVGHLADERGYDAEVL